MNAQRDVLLHQLDNSIALLARLRTSDATCIAAFDSLKQARALVARAFAEDALTPGLHRDIACDQQAA